MTKFINNLNKYLSEMKIKQNCLSMLTGIDKNKLSRLLTGVQDESGTDMEKIAQALGKDVEFFLKDSIFRSNYILEKYFHFVYLCNAQF